MTTRLDSRLQSNVLAIVVTYNRKSTLIRCVEGVLAQTHQVDRIVVVDNNSSDGTEDALNERGVLDYDQVDYIRLDANLGGAGGFRAGIEYASRYSSDWMWLMDDDVEPAETCLEYLLRNSQDSECIHPRRMNLLGEPYSWEQTLDIMTGTRTLLRDDSFRNGKTITYSNVACFEGMLVSTRIIDIIGPPASEYFIGDDDTLFGVKASVHTNVAYVADAWMTRLLPIGRPAPWKNYYLIRNRFYLHRDACDYLGIKPSRTQRLLFYTAQAVELMRAVRLGPKHLLPAVRGAVHGIRYLRRA